MKVLAIDYGTKRVGVAVSYASLAQPLQIIANDEYLLDNISRLITQHHVDHLVVGLSENQMAVQTQAFVKRLQTITALPITLVDETLTSYQVHQWLREQPRGKRQGPIDHFAAAVILENYLSSLDA